MFLEWVSKRKQTSRARIVPESRAGINKRAQGRAAPEISIGAYKNTRNSDTDGMITTITIEQIRKIIKHCSRNCHIVCLSILHKLTEIQKIIKNSENEFYSRSQLINFKVECLQAMAKNNGLTQLNDREK